MKITCPHCQIQIEIDPETHAALQGHAHFQCPSCGGLVPVLAMQLPRLIAPSRGTPPPQVRPHQTARAAGSSPLLHSHRGMNRNLLILGSVALLTLGGLAFFIASRSGTTQDTKLNVVNEITNNSYFTNLISSGATTLKDLDAVTNVRPYENGFIGISAEPLTWPMARELAGKTGSMILNSNLNGSGNNRTLLSWLAATFPAETATPLWMDREGKPGVLSYSEVFVGDTTDAKRRVLLHWQPSLETPAKGNFPADMTKPVKVFILMGQANMVGLGKIAGGEGSLENAVKTKKLYPYLVDQGGKWTERKDVRNVRVMRNSGSMQLFNNEWMTVTGTKSIGPEFGIGDQVGNAIDAPVMILKSCTGYRSLGWDYLPPGSERFEFEGKTYAGYKDSPESWAKGSEPQSIEWYAGKQYDDDVADAKKVLAELDKYYPGATKYEVAGFFLWQGEKDCSSAAHASRYERNLVQFIKQLRKDFDAPNAKFVLATLGEATKGIGGNGGKVLDAQLAVDGTSGKYPEFKGNVATVYANPLSKGGTGNSSYNGNAETYMEVGEGMGKAMVDLLENQK